MKEKHYAVSQSNTLHNITDEDEEGYTIWSPPEYNILIVSKTDIAYTVTIKSWKK